MQELGGVQVVDASGQERLTMERRIGERARRVEKTIDRRTGEEETCDHSYGIGTKIERMKIEGSEGPCQHCLWQT